MLVVVEDVVDEDIDVVDKDVDAIVTGLTASEMRV